MLASDNKLNIGSLVESRGFGKGIVVKKAQSAYVVMWYEEQTPKGPLTNAISKSPIFPYRWKDIYGKSVSILSEGNDKWHQT